MFVASSFVTPHRGCTAPLGKFRTSLPTALYSSRPQNGEGDDHFNHVPVTSSRKKNKAATCFISLLCAATILIGTFDGSNYSEASELNVSDQLLQSLTAHQNDKSSSTRSPKYKQRYWDAIASGDPENIKFVNEKLIDHAVSTISTMYYDSSGGFDFDPQQFYTGWKASRSSSSLVAKEKKDLIDNAGFANLGEKPFETRENTVKSLKAIVASLNDPYSKYLTRDELKNELIAGDSSFLGLGALVETPKLSMSQLPSYSIPKNEKSSVRDVALDKISKRNLNGQYDGRSTRNNNYEGSTFRPTNNINEDKLLSVAQAGNLPVVTAIVPDSPAERAGIVVGDRIASVGNYQFMGLSRSQVKKALEHKFHAENYFGNADLTIAKRIMTSPPETLDVGNAMDEKYVFTEDGTTAKYPEVFGGDSIVHYELLTPDDSIFQFAGISNPSKSGPVGYIRLTRFSKASTNGYINAVKALEDAGAQSYIIDLRNNYGGVIQEAMLTASTLLRDPHVVLCYTLNSRGGFKPQENMEYIVDRAYPGYLLSTESSTVSRDWVQREHPEYLLDGGWTSPTSYASLKELRMTRGIKPAARMSTIGSSGEMFQPVAPANAAALDSSQRKKDTDLEMLADILSRNSQKKLVLLINEGTASSAEVFASALHDNGRTVALVGTKTFGKGVIQHTFPMPDGGGLRLTVAEYLTPSLHHVSKVGTLKYDSGIRPDVYCESKSGIPKNVGADLCVGVALDVLESERI
ncbi:hypothetical protein ACHAWC_011166 [Mediolabrus comicus]